MIRSLIEAMTARAHTLRYGFLFLPGAISLVLGLLAVALVRLDRSGGTHGLGVGFTGGPDAARNVLSTIAGSLITVAGLTFSITIVSLQLVSQQFTPRALRGFLGDRTNQAIAGTFVGIFLYSLLVLRAIRDPGEGADLFVPALSTTVGIALGVLALALLLVFIHRMLLSIQVSHIAGAISHATLGSIRELYPDGYGEDVDADPDALLQEWYAAGEPAYVYATRPGYVQAIEDVAAAAGVDGARIHVLIAPGDFVTERQPLVALWVDGDVEEVVANVRRVVVVADERDLHQDTAYGVRQLADIAIKALSPTLNDPTTACTCIGHLEAILERIVERRFPSSVRRFPAYDALVVVRQHSFEEFVDTAFVQVGRYADDARVVEAVLGSIARVARAVRACGPDERLRVLGRAAARIGARALEGGRLDRDDREEVEALLDRVEELVGETLVR